MSTATNLMNLGVPAEQAKRTGWSIVSATTTATTQNSAGGALTGQGNKLVRATIAGAGHAVTLPLNADVGDEVEVYNETATAGVIYPPTGATLNQLAANTSTALAANASARCIKIGATAWRVAIAAAIS